MGRRRQKPGSTPIEQLRGSRRRKAVGPAGHPNGLGAPRSPQRGRRGREGRRGEPRSYHGSSGGQPAANGGAEPEPKPKQRSAWVSAPAGAPRRPLDRSARLRDTASADRAARAAKRPRGRKAAKAADRPLRPPGRSQPGPTPQRGWPKGGARRLTRRATAKAQRSKGDHSAAEEARSAAKPGRKHSGMSERPRSREAAHTGRTAQPGGKGQGPGRTWALSAGFGPRSGWRARRPEARPRRAGPRRKWPRVVGKKGRGKSGARQAPRPRTGRAHTADVRSAAPFMGAST